MKIIALNASHRGSKGCTGFLLKKLALGAEERGAVFTTVTLIEKKIKPCIGCNICHTANHYLRCIYDEQDDVRKIFEQMREADIIIYASPVYIFGISGILKTFLDRINSTGDSSKLCLSDSGLFFHHIDKAIYTKPSAFVTCCDNLEDETVKNVISYFRTLIKFLDAPEAGILVRKSAKMLGYNQTNSAYSPKATAIIEAYIQAGRELAEYKKIAPRTLKEANQHLLEIPLLNFLLKFRSFKCKAIQKAQEIIDNLKENNA